jgi:hypothetical protein
VADIQWRLTYLQGRLIKGLMLHAVDRFCHFELNENAFIIKGLMLHAVDRFCHFEFNENAFIIKIYIYIYNIYIFAMQIF